MAAQEQRLVGITPAMCEGSGMVEFAASYPDRYHDVAIAEDGPILLEVNKRYDLLILQSTQPIGDTALGLAALAYHQTGELPPLHSDGGELPGSAQPVRAPA